MSDEKQPLENPAGAQLTVWEVEDEEFWQSKGKKIAQRNLWISIPCLLLGFAIWGYWSVITVKMKALGFPFSKEELMTLPAIAGLMGATLRIPHSFMIAICGGRNVIGVTTALLLLPAVGTGIALQNPDTSYTTFCILAALCGFGGGAFASSMSNISFFFPKRVQGLSLGLNAGLGNIGVSIMQILLPAVMTLAIFGPISGDGRRTTDGSDTLVWLQNCGLVWVPMLVVLVILAFTMMNNLPQQKLGNTASSIGKILWLTLLGIAGGAVGVGILIGVDIGIPKLLKIALLVPAAICTTLLLMRYLTPRPVQDNLTDQFAIFRNKHNWIMTWLYTMTFGSFIGYSFAFPLLIKFVFGYPDVEGAPNPLHYAWLGPLVGALSRPVGGWISDKWGGARVTHWNTMVMIGTTIGAGYFVQQATGSATPHDYWWPFFACFMVLFLATGVGNGSTFRMVPIIFEKKYAGPVLGWTSAVAAYGAFLIPKIFGTQLDAKTPHYALYGFAGYYITCLFVNWWFYARKNAEIPC